MSGFLSRVLTPISATMLVLAVVACAAASATSPPTAPTATSVAPTASLPPSATVVATAIPATTPPAVGTAVPTTVPPSPTATVASNPTVASEPTATAIVTPVLAADSTPTGTPSDGLPPYLDDRSDGADVIRSYYNAINRKEYDRAYSYWEPGPRETLPSYSQFKQGYADTTSVQLTIGQVYADAGAGQRYDAVPVALVATQTDGTTQAYAGCYTLHLANPAIQDQPPFDPWQIQSAKIQKLSAGTNLTDQLSSACLVNGQPPGVPIAAQPTASPTDISKSSYLDDRSTAEDVLRSYYNAINREEYDRAYSYWEPAAAATQIPPYGQFKQGYADTASVDLTLGNATVGAAAGNLYFHVPTALVAHTKGGQTQTFVGCYTLHLGQPATQDLPPYQPLAIQSADLKQVSNDANLATLLNGVCPTP